MKGLLQIICICLLFVGCNNSDQFTNSIDNISIERDSIKYINGSTEYYARVTNNNPCTLKSYDIQFILDDSFIISRKDYIKPYNDTSIYIKHANYKGYVELVLLNPVFE